MTTVFIFSVIHPLALRRPEDSMEVSLLACSPVCQYTRGGEGMVLKCTWKLGILRRNGGRARYVAGLVEVREGRSIRL